MVDSIFKFALLSPGLAKQTRVWVQRRFRLFQDG
jgi:hypothetical protein